MALEEVFRALESEAQARCSEIRISAAEESERIGEQAARRCSEIVRERLEAQQAPVRLRARAIVNAANMEARRLVSAEKDRQVEATFATALEAMTQVRGQPGYANAMERLFDEACAFRKAPSSVAVNEADAELVSQLLANRGTDVPVRADSSVSAGVVVFSDGDRVKHDNSAEARLARLREGARESVSEMLFG